MKKDENNNKNKYLPICDCVCMCDFRPNYFFVWMIPSEASFAAARDRERPYLAHGDRAGVAAIHIVFMAGVRCRRGYVRTDVQRSMFAVPLQTTEPLPTGPFPLKLGLFLFHFLVPFVLMSLHSIC
jgi:hypothetical protein